MDTQDEPYTDREPDEDPWADEWDEIVDDNGFHVLQRKSIDPARVTNGREPDCEYSPDGTHTFIGVDDRCIDCDRKPWYETATAAGRRAKADREAAIAAFALKDESDIW